MCDPFGIKLHQHYSDYLVMSSLPPSPPTLPDHAAHLQFLTTANTTTTTAGQKDTTFTKIFVGGLPYHTTDKSLRQFFEAFGEIEEAVVITDRQTGKSRGYGFVTMADRDSAERAVKDANPIIDGRKANVNLAYLGAKPRSNAQNVYISPHHYVHHPTAASPYISAAPSLLLPPPAATLSAPHFYYYPPAAYPPPPPYASTNGLESAYGAFHAPHQTGPIGPAAAAASPVAGGTAPNGNANVHPYSAYTTTMSAPMPCPIEQPRQQ